MWRCQLGESKNPLMVRGMEQKEDRIKAVMVIPCKF